MKKTLVTLSIAALLGSLAFSATAAVMPRLDSGIARAERVEKPQKPEKKEKVGAVETFNQLARAERAEKPQKPEKKEKVGAADRGFQLAREASERPRGTDKDRRGGRHA